MVKPSSSNWDTADQSPALLYKTFWYKWQRFSLLVSIRCLKVEHLFHCQSSLCYREMKPVMPWTCARTVSISKCHFTTWHEIKCCQRLQLQIFAALPDGLCKKMFSFFTAFSTELSTEYSTKHDGFWMCTDIRTQKRSQFGSYPIFGVMVQCELVRL